MTEENSPENNAGYLRALKDVTEKAKELSERGNEAEDARELYDLTQGFVDKIQSLRIAEIDRFLRSLY